MRRVPNKEWLTVDEDGNTFSTRTGKPYKGCYDKDGYVRVSTRHLGKSVKCSVHRAVALAYLPNPENKPTVNHKNGIKDDNRLCNLEWATLSEQQLHAYQTGLKPNKVKGEDSHFCEYGEVIAKEVCYLIQEGYRNKDILKLYPDMDVKLPSDIRNGRSWKHISCDYDLSKQRVNRMSMETIRWVCSKLEEGLHPTKIKKLSNNPNLSVNTIRNIKDKVYYTNISKDYNF